MKKNHKKWLWHALIVGVAVALTLVIVCDAIVVHGAKGRIFDSVEQIPHNRVGLLLGTSPITPQGEHNYYFDYRIDAAAALFAAGKVDYILISGDRHGDNYDETRWMADSLVAHGVATGRILTDPAGFRTINSMENARQRFGCDSLTIISQHFHNERALYLAGHVGIEAVAYDAQDVTLWHKWLKIHSREFLARVKLFIDTTL